MVDETPDALFPIEHVTLTPRGPYELRGFPEREVLFLVTADGVSDPLRAG